MLHVKSGPASGSKIVRTLQSSAGSLSTAICREVALLILVVVLSTSHAGEVASPVVVLLQKEKGTTCAVRPTGMDGMFRHISHGYSNENNW